MAAPKPTMRRRKAPTAAALEFVEGKKTPKSRSEPDSGRRKAKPKSKPKKPARAQQADVSGERVPKRLYIPAEVDQALRLRAATDGVQQSEIATEALMRYLGL